MSKTILVYGGAGQLGRVVLGVFREAGFRTCSVDFRDAPSDVNYLLKSEGSLSDQVIDISKRMDSDKLKFDVVICAAGGWAGGSIKSAEVFKSVEQMWNMCVQSALSCSHLASQLLVESGFLVLTGAKAALGPTPGMIGYGIAKAATHHLVKSLASGGLPEKATVAAILPVTLDTETNRKGMPNADFSTWTPLDVVAKKLLAWANGEDKPSNGALVSVVTKNDKTEFVQEQ